MEIKRDVATEIKAFVRMELGLEASRLGLKQKMQPASSNKATDRF